MPLDHLQFLQCFELFQDTFLLCFLVVESIPTIEKQANVRSLDHPVVAKAWRLILNHWLKPWIAFY